MTARMQKAHRAAWRKDIKRSKSSASMHSQYLREPMTPQSPGLSSASLSSRGTSFSSVSDYAQTMTLNVGPTILHQPPTPQSPYYPDSHDLRSVSPQAMPHSQPESYEPVTYAQPHDSLRIVCTTPTPQQLLVAAQSIQNSPGGLSNCSSASSSADSYFYGRPHPSATPSYTSSPLTPVSVPPYSAAPMSAGPTPQVWYDFQPYGQPNMIMQPGQPRIYYAAPQGQEMYLKQEPEMMGQRTYC